MTNRSIIALIALAVAIFLVTQTFYTVDPTKQVLVRQFGAIVGEPKTDPGLYAKIPLVQDIQRIDRRLLDYEAEEFEIIAGDQKRLVVDAYARYKITAAKLFAQTVPGGEAALRGLLDSLINSEIRGVLSSVPLHAVLTDRRESLMDEITKRVNAKTKDLGVEVVDVRIKRADLPTEVQASVYARMRAERDRIAKRYRAEGEERARQIRASADKDREIIVAKAYEESQRLTGDGDAEAVATYARAFGQDPEFYGFLRRLETYEKIFAEGTTVILPADSDLLRYLQGPGAR